MSIDLSKQKQDEIMKGYGNLVCEKCKDKLYTNMIPIKERLDKGKPPFPRHLIKLQKSLCPQCLFKIANKKAKNEV